MFKEHQTASPFDNDDWSERSNYWANETAKKQAKRKVRQRNPNPLILTGHGTSLRIEQGSLSIKQGFTHYPQKAETFRFFNGDLNLPRLIMLLDGSGSLSFDVLSWLAEQGVALARIQWGGESSVFASGAGFTGNAENLRWQYETQSNEKLRLEFARKLIREKLANSIATLEIQIPPSELRERAMTKFKSSLEDIQSEPLNDMNDLRAIEGEYAASYFSAWKAVELKWRATNRHPIPDTWHNYRSRSSILTGIKARNWKASHPLNAMLNYAYAVKIAQIQIELTANGFDPFTGIMHHSRPTYAAYAYDLIEPERPKVDAIILQFAQATVFSGADFIMRKDGACRLSPQLAKRVANLVIG